MKTIQIAPRREDCTIDDTTIRGTMDGRTFVFQLAAGDTFNREQDEEFIKCFHQAIAICSKQWQIEELLNTHFGITGARFYEETRQTATTR